MNSYKKHRNFFGFQYTEWGPNAVKNFCNMQEDRVNNMSLFSVYLLLLIIGGVILWLKT